MRHSREYVDIYSHTGDINSPTVIKNQRTKKSRGILKGILCFLVITSCCTLTVCAYIFGIFIGRKSESKSQVVPNITESSIDVAQNNFKTGIIDAIDSVIGICVYNGTQSTFASGVIISNDGYIITNDHIFSGIKSPEIKAYDADGNYYNAAFIGADAKSDIAVIKIEKLGLTAAKTAKSVSIGQRVYCIGCPMDSTLSLSVTQGIISGINRRVGSLTNEYSPRLIQTDAAINPGNSGGALINESGQVIGISCSKVSDYSYEGIGFAIPIDEAITMANQLIENGSISGRAKLGISYTAINYGQALATNSVCGICINSVEVLSDLYGKGFGKGDTITAINGNRIKSEDDFLSIIESSKPNDKITLSITTVGGMTRETEVILMEEKPIFSYSG